MDRLSLSKNLTKSDWFKNFKSDKADLVHIKVKFFELQWDMGFEVILFFLGIMTSLSLRGLAL